MIKVSIPIPYLKEMQNMKEVATVNRLFNNNEVNKTAYNSERVKFSKSMVA
jgi:hypothetical protein